MHRSRHFPFWVGCTPTQLLLKRPRLTELVNSRSTLPSSSSSWSFVLASCSGSMGTALRPRRFCAEAEAERVAAIKRREGICWNFMLVVCSLVVAFGFAVCFFVRGFGRAFEKVHPRHQRLSSANAGCAKVLDRSVTCFVRAGAMRDPRKGSSEETYYSNVGDITLSFLATTQITQNLLRDAWKKDREVDVGLDVAAQNSPNKEQIHRRRERQPTVKAAHKRAP